MSLPHYPDRENEPASRAPSHRTKLVVAVIVVLVAGVIALHVAGVFGH
jgi:hypothetical protein